MLPEEQIQVIGVGVDILKVDPGIYISCGKKGRFPANERAKTAQAVHQPVGQNIGTGLLQNLQEYGHHLGPRF